MSIANNKQDLVNEQSPENAIAPAAWTPVQNAVDWMFSISAVDGFYSGSIYRSFQGLTGLSGDVIFDVLKPICDYVSALGYVSTLDFLGNAIPSSDVDGLFNRIAYGSDSPVVEYVDISGGTNGVPTPQQIQVPGEIIIDFTDMVNSVADACSASLGFTLFSATFDPDIAPDGEGDDPYAGTFGIQGTTPAQMAERFQAHLPIDGGSDGWFLDSAVEDGTKVRIRVTANYASQTLSVTSGSEWCSATVDIDHVDFIPTEAITSVLGFGLYNVSVNEYVNRYDNSRGVEPVEYSA